MKGHIGAGLAIALLAAWMQGHPARAADAAHPYSNIDRGVDAGNDTGDSEVDRLNQQQLDQGGAGDTQGSQTPASGRWSGSAPAPGYARPGYGGPLPYGVAVPIYRRHPRWWRHRLWVHRVYP